MNYMKNYGSKFAFFKKLLNKENPKILEIGSHYGEDSLRFLETFPAAQIYCFEPDPRNVEVFRKHINCPQIRLFDVALSNVTGYTKFYQSYSPTSVVPEKYDWIDAADYQQNMLNSSGSSSLKPGLKNVLTSIDIQTVRYDDWEAENCLGEIDLAWIDVQGAERDVLVGMGDQMRNIRFFWIEFGETEYEEAMSLSDTISLFSSKGYEFRGHNSPDPLNYAGDALFERIN